MTSGTARAGPSTSSRETAPSVARNRTSSSEAAASSRMRTGSRSSRTGPIRPRFRTPAPVRPAGRHRSGRQEHRSDQATGAGHADGRPGCASRSATAGAPRMGRSPRTSRARSAYTAPAVAHPRHRDPECASWTGPPPRPPARTRRHGAPPAMSRREARSAPREASGVASATSRTTAPGATSSPTIPVPGPRPRSAIGPRRPKPGWPASGPRRARSGRGSGPLRRSPRSGHRSGHRRTSGPRPWPTG